MQFSQKQKQVFDLIMDFFFNSTRGGFVLSGVAGSGKTTIVQKVHTTLKRVGLNGACIAPTGKAASNLPNGRTIHSTIYTPVINDKNELIGFEKHLFLEYDYLIVDEAGMVDSLLFNDLTSYGIPILFVGDKEQLPPVQKDFDIMRYYDFHLDEIHRVAEGNPIIQLSRELRETGKINKKYVDGNTIRLVKEKDVNKQFISGYDHDVIVCGTNQVRRRMNLLSRFAKGYVEDYAENGEKIVALKNQSDLNFNTYSNGEIFTVGRIFNTINQKAMRYRLFRDNGDEILVDVENECWENDTHEPDDGGRFTFAYAMTCHKMQGSQMQHVMFYDEDVSFFLDRRRFRYSGITRASHRLTIIE